MEITWAGLKEVFFSIGSMAGLLACLKPVVDSKFNRDEARLKGILDALNESELASLPLLGQQSKVSGEIVNACMNLVHARAKQLDRVCFSGPYSKLYSAHVEKLADACDIFHRELRVGWTTMFLSGTERVVWHFDRKKFESRTPSSKGLIIQTNGLDDHLSRLCWSAGDLLVAYRQLRIVSELHLLEWPFSKWLLQRRSKHFS